MRPRKFMTIATMTALTVSITACGQTDREIALFNGRDLSGWDYYLVDEAATMEDVWSVEEGLLVCRGEPRGYLYTADDYQDFRLVVEWRWPGTSGNSGVLMRVVPEPVMLPDGVEAQLRSGSAGDMYGFKDFQISGDAERLSEISIGRALTGIQRNEREPGEWNYPAGERLTGGRGGTQSGA